MIAWRRRRGVPDRGEIGSEGDKAISFFLAENARSLLQSAGEFFVRRLQLSQKTQLGFAWHRRRWFRFLLRSVWIIYLNDLYLGAGKFKI